MLEEWNYLIGKDSPSGIGYYISNTGRVKTSQGKERKVTFGFSFGKRYGRITLGEKTYLIHRLVAEAFVSNPHNFETVDHLDGDEGNNLASNLEWVTLQENTTRGQGIAVARFSLKGLKIDEWRSAAEASRVLGLYQANISAVCNGKQKSSGGFLWEYI